MLSNAGLRVFAFDNVGFGRSDKLIDPTDYTFARNVDWVHSAITRLDLRDITLVVRDWGGPIGLSVLARDPRRFARVVATNTILHTCDPDLAGKLTWPHHAVGDGQVVLAAYDAPFPAREYTAALRQLTALIPLTRFLQEQRGEELGRIVADFVASCA